MEIELPEDFREFLSLLNAHNVHYMLIGGHAVGAHGFVRATNDIDVWIESSLANARRVEAAIRAFGFDVPELAAEKLIEPSIITRMGVTPMRIEVLNSISGVTFGKAFPNRVFASVQGTSIPVIGLSDLLTNKRASGRNKDLADIDELGQIEP